MRSIKTTSLRVLGSLVKFESDQNHCRAAGTISNTGTEDLQMVPGTLLTGGAVPAVFDTAAVAAVTGVCITAVLIPVGQSAPIAWFERGPLTLNSNEIDFPANAGQRTTIEGEIADLGIKLTAGIDGIN